MRGNFQASTSHNPIMWCKCDVQCHCQVGVTRVGIGYRLYSGLVNFGSGRFISGFGPILGGFFW